jgi:hypothetical protein
MQSKLFFFLLLTVLTTTIYCQDFKKWRTTLGKEIHKILQYEYSAYHSKNSFFPYQLYPTNYEIGLIAFTKSIASDDFMLVGQHLILKDLKTLSEKKKMSLREWFIN